jgi:hypothetical protein
MHELKHADTGIEHEDLLVRNDLLVLRSMHCRLWQALHWKSTVVVETDWQSIHYRGQVQQCFLSAARNK